MKDKKIKSLEHRIEFLQKRVDEKLLEEFGNEHKFTYWAGWSLGYYKGQISIMEDFLAYLKEEEL